MIGCSNKPFVMTPEPGSGSISASLSAVEKGQVTHEYADQAHLFLAASPREEEVAAFFTNGEVRWPRRYLKGRLRRRLSLGG
jgi:hypothetical protein